MIDFPTDRTTWFRDARFGMFIHWGLYSILGRGEWVMNRERIPLEEYKELVDEFDAGDFDPREWARIARDTGMRYLVLTAKHHEGFCLWDARHTDFTATRSAAGRDLLAEYVVALRDADLKVGVYYSLGDWSQPDWRKAVTGDPDAAVRFVEWTHAMVDDLVTNYGRIDVLWYDLPQGLTADQWRSVELNASVRSRQPHILINNRAYTTEDLATPEQSVKAAKPGRLWEACVTMNSVGWGYNAYDPDWKSPREIALLLARCASGQGNLLLNVGPEPSGRIPERARTRLAEIGDWFSLHQEALLNTDQNPLSWYLFGPTTCRGNTLYCFLRNYYGTSFVVGGLTNRVKSAELLDPRTSLDVAQRGPQTIVNGLPKEAPGFLPVVKLELDGKPDHDISRDIGFADVFPDLPS